MVTAVDTNIFLDILRPNPAFAEPSAAALSESASAGAVVICDAVFAELCAQFDELSECEAFLEAASIQVESLSREALFAASRSFMKYRSRGGKRERLLADFLVGAHATHQATRLLSRDQRFFSTYFPQLNCWCPR